jgi:hypothetical protein
MPTPEEAQRLGARNRPACSRAHASWLHGRREQGRFKAA